MADIIESVGYDNSSYFFRKFKECYGVARRRIGIVKRCDGASGICVFQFRHISYLVALFFLSYHQIGFSQDRYFEPAVSFAAI